MDMTKIVAIALVAVIIVTLLKQYRPEFATYTTLVAGVLILYIVLKELTPVVTLLQNLSNKLGVSSKFLGILLKITGIAYLSEFGANLCRDSGETAIASKVELGRKSFNYQSFHSYYYHVNGYTFRNNLRRPRQ